MRLGAKMSYEEILNQVKSFGKYQQLLILVLALVRVPSAFHFIGQVFLAADTDHWCLVNSSYATNCNSSTECFAEWKGDSIPLETDENGNEVYSSCERYTMEEAANSTLTRNATATIPCDAGWMFDHSRYKSTINEDFTLVCDRGGFSDIAQSVWFAGLLVGSSLWGTVADWFGRKKAFFISLTLLTTSAIATTFAPSFLAYMALRFVAASCIIGTLLTTSVIVVEIVSPQKRAATNIILFAYFSVGYIILTFMAFFLRDWRHLQLAISLPYLLAFLLFFILPESPRWLILKGRYKEAGQILKKIAKVNGVRTPDHLQDELKESLQEESKKTSRKVITQLDLIRTPNMRKKTLIICFDYFVANMAYYGLSLSTSALGIDEYLAAFVSAAIEIPSCLTCWFLMERFGRRRTLTAFYTSGGLFCLVTIFAPLGAARVAVAMTGKFAINAAFAHITVYACELYPTVIRSMGLGVASTVSRISGILSPLILLMGRYWQPLPLCVFGASSVLAGLLTLMLPETKDCSLPDTIRDGENFGKVKGFQELSTKSSEATENDSNDSYDNDSNEVRPRDHIPMHDLEKIRPTEDV